MSGQVYRLKETRWRRGGGEFTKLHWGQNSIDRMHQSMGSPADQERIKAEVRPSEEMEEGSTLRGQFDVFQGKKD